MNVYFEKILQKLDWVVLLELAGFFLVFFRFIYLLDAPFVFDEPMMQIFADQSWQNKSIPLTGLMGSSLPFPYGGGAVWLYLIPKVFSSSSIAFLYFHTAFFCLGIVFFYFGLRMLYGRMP